MSERVYIETTFVSYLVARPSRDIVVTGHQQLTREWWEECRTKYELCISQIVIDEASAGDPIAANERLSILRPMLVLEATHDALTLARDLLRMSALPSKAANDALHIAIASTHSIPYLLTWNCRHLANAVMKPLIESVCNRAGFRAPVICTPEELMDP